MEKERVHDKRFQWCDDPLCLFLKRLLLHWHEWSSVLLK
uniref:Uncharacterized protein n=1 Tax=Anguilla anguilla TaxID=7936 RepID=A0A0E9SFW0_ANGAN